MIAKFSNATLSCSIGRVMRCPTCFRKRLPSPPPGRYRCAVCATTFVIDSFGDIANVSAPKDMFFRVKIVFLLPAIVFWEAFDRGEYPQWDLVFGLLGSLGVWIAVLEGVVTGRVSLQVGTFFWRQHPVAFVIGMALLAGLGVALVEQFFFPDFGSGGGDFSREGWFD